MECASREADFIPGTGAVLADPPPRKCAGAGTGHAAAVTGERTLGLQPGPMGRPGDRPPDPAGAGSAVGGGPGGWEFRGKMGQLRIGVAPGAPGYNRAEHGVS